MKKIILYYPFIVLFFVLCWALMPESPRVEAQRIGRMGVLVEDANGVDNFVQKIVFDNMDTTIGVSADVTVDSSITTPSSAQVIDATSDAILANALIVVLNPDADYTTDVTPTIADGTTGQFLYITCANGEANRVRLQDEDYLTGTNLELGDTSRDVSGKDVLTLIFDGTDWIEQSYTNN